MSSLQIPRGPRRIVCLTEEPTEILYLLGEEERIVGISAYTKRPPRAMEEKPAVSAFVKGNLKKIKALQPDLVLGFSDIQSKLAETLIAEGLPVLIFNQRSLQEILGVILDIGSLVGRRREARDYIQNAIDHLEQARERNARRPRRPRVYFEEWDEPMICGIRWVSELIDIAGGEDVFAAKARGKSARERFVSLPELQAAAPEVVLASWCGKPFDAGAFARRDGLQSLPAVQASRLHEIPSEIILQPGPACLFDGLTALERAIHGKEALQDAGSRPG